MLPALWLLSTVQPVTIACTRDAEVFAPRTLAYTNISRMPKNVATSGTVTPPQAEPHPAPRGAAMAPMARVRAIVQFEPAQWMGGGDEPDEELVKVAPLTERDAPLLSSLVPGVYRQCQMLRRPG